MLHNIIEIIEIIMEIIEINSIKWVQFARPKQKQIEAYLQLHTFYVISPHVTNIVKYTTSLQYYHYTTYFFTNFITPKKKFRIQLKNPKFFLHHIKKKQPKFSYY